MIAISFALLNVNENVQNFFSTTNETVFNN